MYYLGLPMPVNIRSTSISNTSVTLTWQYPPPPFQAIQGFLVSFIATLWFTMIMIDLFYDYEGDLLR